MLHTSRQLVGIAVEFNQDVADAEHMLADIRLAVARVGLVHPRQPLPLLPRHLVGALPGPDHERPPGPRRRGGRAGAERGFAVAFAARSQRWRVRPGGRVEVEVCLCKPHLLPALGPVLEPLRRVHLPSQPLVVPRQHSNRIHDDVLGAPTLMGTVSVPEQCNLQGGINPEQLRHVPGSPSSGDALCKPVCVQARGVQDEALLPGDTVFKVLYPARHAPSLSSVILLILLSGAIRVLAGEPVDRDVGLVAAEPAPLDRALARARQAHEEECCWSTALRRRSPGRVS
mmetsp:Transcript_96820/g.283032  ORF Transcript_96820/g.283032 Transcript_96820/m.283032 type:complete len:286 (-) Transcript_96820:147-1004(-)